MMLSTRDAGGLRADQGVGQGTGSRVQAATWVWWRIKATTSAGGGVGLKGPTGLHCSAALLTGIEGHSRIHVSLCTSCHSLSCLSCFVPYVCSACGHKEHTFGQGGVQRMAEEFHLDVLGQVSHRGCVVTSYTIHRFGQCQPRHGGLGKHTGTVFLLLRSAALPGIWRSPLLHPKHSWPGRHVAVCVYSSSGVILRGRTYPALIF